MAAMDSSQHVRHLLFPKTEQNTFAVLDGASVPGLIQQLSSHAPPHVCLYRGEIPLDLAHCAPYLVQLDPDSPFSEWVLSKGWGHHWGIFAVTTADLRTLRSHFRKFLIVKTPDDKRLYFRYYDPRVLRVYLPTCNAEETQVVFGPISYYGLEGEDPRIFLRIAPGASGPQVDEIALGAEVGLR